MISYYIYNFGYRIGYKKVSALVTYSLDVNKCVFYVKKRL